MDNMLKICLSLLFLFLTLAYGLPPCIVCDADCASGLRRVYKSTSDSPFWQGKPEHLPDCRSDLQLRVLCRYNGQVLLPTVHGEKYDFEGPCKPLNTNTTSCPELRSEVGSQTNSSHRTHDWKWTPCILIITFFMIIVGW